MAAFTTAQAGNWSTGSTWTGGVAPGSGDTATINHAVTIAASASIAGLAINAALTVSTGATFTLSGNCVQGNAGFTLSAGSGLVFDCTAADVKWLFGDAANFTNYTSCTFKAAGTPGSRCSVSKSGANHCWFDDFSENSGNGAGKTGYDCAYCDFTGIGKSDGSVSLGLDDFGALNQRLDHCTFSSCAEVFPARPYTWAGSSNKDYYIRDCTFSGSTGATYCCAIKADGSSGTGAHDVTRNSFDKAVDANAKVDFVDNYFAHGIFFGGTPLSNVGNLFRIGSGDGDQYCGCGVSDGYWLAALNHPGNPHCLNNPPDGSTVSGVVFEYPIAANIDSGECVYLSGPGATVTVTGNLAVPSATDGYAIGNVAHHARSSGTQQWSVTKNTVVGANNAFGAYSEAGADPGSPLYSAVKSNLIVDPSGSSASVVREINASTNTWKDLVLGGNATNNGKFGTASFTDPATSNSYPGYVARFTSAPGTGDVTGDPGFVDSTRNFGNWAVHKGAASSGDTLATKTAAAISLVSATPSLIRSDLIPWVRAGFAPTNSAFATAGHDGGVIGAVAYAGSGVSFSLAPTLAAVSLSASFASSSPPSSSWSFAPTLAAVTLSATFTTASPAAASFVVSPILANLALSASFVSTSPGSSSFTVAPTLAPVSLASTFVAAASGSSSFALAPTLAPTTLTASFATTAPSSASFALAPTLAAVAFSASFTASTSGDTTFSLAAPISAVALSADLSTTQPAASALALAASLADVALAASLASAGPGSSSFGLAATLANCTATLHILVTGGEVIVVRHPDPGRSYANRLGPDPSRSQGRRLGPDPGRSAGTRV